MVQLLGFLIMLILIFKLETLENITELSLTARSLVKLTLASFEQ